MVLYIFYRANFLLPKKPERASSGAGKTPSLSSFFFDVVLTVGLHPFAHKNLTLSGFQKAHRADLNDPVLLSLSFYVEGMEKGGLGSKYFVDLNSFW